MAKKKKQSRGAGKPARKASPTKKGKASTKPKRGAPETGIDFTRPVSKIDVSKASDVELKRDRNRIYQERWRLKQKLEVVKLKKTQNQIRKRLQRTTTHLISIKKARGTYREREGFDPEKQQYEVGDDIIVDRVFKWEIAKFIDDLLESKLYKKYIIDDQPFSSRAVMKIAVAINDMEVEADLKGIYFFTVTQNLKTKTVTVTM